MGKETGRKLNYLMRDLPEGLLVTAAWLGKRHYSPQLLHKYTVHGWLERLVQGVYRRPGGKLVWEQIVISLQAMLALPLTVGGKTALSLHGFEHYVSRAFHDVHLYGPSPTPAWLNKLPDEALFHYHNTSPLFHHALPTVPAAAQNENGRDSRALPTPQLQIGFEAFLWGQWNWPLILSTPERAILEFLDGLPQQESFEAADKYMEGLTNLRPKQLQKLLADCQSIKVKRLFLFYADRHQHAWLKHLDQSLIDLGTGKRMLVPGGKLDSRYAITIPEEYHGRF